MAQRAHPLVIFAGAAALCVVALATVVPVASLWLGAQLIGGSTDGPLLTQADLAALRFTLLQSVLSAILSVAFAIPAARAIFRRRFLGRQLLVTALGSPFLIPVIVAVLGIVDVWGRSGWVSSMLVSLGFERLSIYGLPGVLLAHVFFNVPLATRLILQGWSRIPPEHLRLAEQVRMSASDQFRHLEWPMLRSVVPGASLLIVLICISSFAVVLALGGGPRATTLELAIFESIRFDFDLSRAALLAILQFLLGLAVAIVVIACGREITFESTLASANNTMSAGTGLRRAIDVLAISALAVFLGLPMSAIAIGGISQLADVPEQVWPALINSAAIAAISTSISVLLGVALSARIATLPRPMASGLELFTVLALSASPLVIGTGLFLLLRPIADPYSLALPVTALVNCAMTLPFTIRILLPAQRRAIEVYGRLSASLGISGWAAVRIVYFPALRAPAGFAAGISAALSMGDLGVVALFAPPDFATLPLVVYRLMGAYRTDQAAGAALILVVASFALFLVLDRGGRLGRSA